MTKNQFRKVAEDFRAFADKEVTYKKWWPSTNKYIVSSGYLVGVGIDANAGCFIIQDFGSLYAIPFDRVTYPKN